MLSGYLKQINIMKIILLFLSLALAQYNKVNGQVYYTKNGNITFFSKSILEDIQADNNQVISVMNVETGTLQFSALNNAFHFPKAKMEEDFNDNYIESNKYPRSTFSGTISNVRDVDFGKDGSYSVMIKGDLTIHGVTKNITTRATVTVSNGNISAAATFNVLVKDYKISVPSIVAKKIAESIQIKVNCNYQKK